MNELFKDIDIRWIMGAWDATARRSRWWDRAVHLGDRRLDPQPDRAAER
jgi:hypothetical protein